MEHKSFGVRSRGLLPAGEAGFLLDCVHDFRTEREWVAEALPLVLPDSGFSGWNWNGAAASPHESVAGGGF